MGKLKFIFVSFLIIPFFIYAQNNIPFSQLKYHGFSNFKDPTSQVGLENIFDGKGFRIGLSVNSIEFLENLAKFTFHSPTKDPIEKFSLFGTLPSPPNRNGVLQNKKVHYPDDLSSSVFNYKGSVFKNRNCFLCHAGVVNGIVTAGLPHSHGDQSTFSAGLRKVLGLEGVLLAQMKTKSLFKSKNAELERNELLYYLNDMKNETAYVLSLAQTRGDNMGPYVVWKKLSRLKDPAKTGLLTYGFGEKSPEDFLFERKELPNVDPHPWWNRKYKNTSYVYGEPAKNTAAHFALNFTKPVPYANEYREKHVKNIGQILNFAYNTTSPLYPRKLDSKMVQIGMELFHGKKNPQSNKMLTCFKCHGTYLKSSNFERPGDWTVLYPNQGVKNVGTDPEYIKVLQTFKILQEKGLALKTFWKNSPELAADIHIPQALGYIAPPLDGIWASAPYFHNGSVPTIYHVLNSKARPTVWARENSNPFTYNFEEVGLTYTNVAMSRSEYLKKQSMYSKKPLEKDAIFFRSIYDSRGYGRSNQGHYFGDSLNDEERFEIIEFLKSLSGPNMKSSN